MLCHAAHYAWIVADTIKYYEEQVAKMSSINLSLLRYLIWGYTGCYIVTVAFYAVPLLFYHAQCAIIPSN